METLAKQALHDPVEIQVGGRSVVNKDITQLIEIRPEADRFLRLLEILGEFYENGKILIFVASQDLCDNLFRDLLKVTSTWPLLLTIDWLADKTPIMLASASNTCKQVARLNKSLFVACMLSLAVKPGRINSHILQMLLGSPA